MILEGLKLMFIGMSTVVLFLTLMILLIQFVSSLTKEATARELEAIRLEREAQARRKKEQLASDESDDDEIVAIAAAVSAYEAERFATS